MTATPVYEHRLKRQSSVLSPWLVPEGRCIKRECSAFESMPLIEFIICASIDPYIPTETTIYQSWYGEKASLYVVIQFQRRLSVVLMEFQTAYVH